MLGACPLAGAAWEQRKQARMRAATQLAMTLTSSCKILIWAHTLGACALPMQPKASIARMRQAAEDIQPTNPMDPTKLLMRVLMLGSYAAAAPACKRRIKQVTLNP